MKNKIIRPLLALSLLFAVSFSPANAASGDGLLFYLSANKGFTADLAAGDAAAIFADKTRIAVDPVSGPYIRSDGEQVLSWRAASNIYAQRGTLAFRFRPRESLGAMQFPIFRTSYADHTSWNMEWLRLDWNGHGIDAFVTDNNLRQVRVSYRMEAIPAPDRWLDIAFSWDETQGVRLYVDGREVAAKNTVAVLDAGLDQFGPFSRVISPMQVQSAYQYVRGGDIDEIRIYDHALAPASIAALTAAKSPANEAVLTRSFSEPRWQQEWLHRYGWDGETPFALTAPQTAIRKVEPSAAWDLKARMMGASDGMAETTWPGVYNRSRLTGRHDYFELPDWNVYAEGGKAVTFDLPDESWNHVEFLGAASGQLTAITHNAGTLLATRPAGEERNSWQFAALKGGKLRFDNDVQETPIQELGVYNIVPGAEPRQAQKLSYTVRASASPAFYPCTEDLTRFIAGRYVADERATVVALPDGAPQENRTAASVRSQPLVHIIVPASFRNLRGGSVAHFSYGWDNAEQGLDGIALDIPALNVKPLRNGLFPLDIRIMDPIWPGRTLMDVTVAVKPGEAHTLWLDTRDRLLPPDASLYLTLAGGGEDFGPAALDGMHLRLVFKPRAAALAEHVADRFAQIRDNVAFVVEEHTNDQRLARYDRLEREFASLFAADPGHKLGRLYWSELNPEQGWPPFTQPTPPKGVPLWAFRQTEDLKLVRRFAEWWIDNRQVAYGDFGGGISDDDDLTQQWPGLAQMGDIPDKLQHSLSALADAVDKNGMITDGLGTILTDYLHSYEEGINARSEDAYLAYGEPKVMERLMQTARAYPRITETNASGRTNIVSQLFSGTRVVREGPWGWEHPYSYLILHPGMLLVNYNGNPGLRKLILDIADSYIAYGKERSDGSFPESFNSATNETRGTLQPDTRGLNGVVQLFWAAYSWTGDEKYLKPLDSVLAPGLHLPLRALNANVIGQLGKSDSWGAQILDYAKSLDGAPGEIRPYYQARDEGSLPENMDRYLAWLKSGDKKYLEDLYADEIQTGSQRMYMVTEGHWWSDRVELFSDLLQRSRLGGLTLRRNQTFPGNLVSWRFSAPYEAEQIGLLIRDAMPEKFGVEAYNLSQKPIAAQMTGWMIAPGTWKMTGKGIKPRTFVFERSASINLTFAPHKTTLLQFERVKAGSDPSTRPDLGIGAEDVSVANGAISLTVHSLGAKDTTGGTAQLLDRKGRVLASAPVPTLAAPLDLSPKTAAIVLPLKKGAARLRVTLGTDEVTRMNNEVALPATERPLPVHRR
jgi:hypothetical protein